MHPHTNYDVHKIIHENGHLKSSLRFTQLISGLFLILFVGSTFYFNNQLQEKNNQLEQKNQEVLGVREEMNELAAENSALINLKLDYEKNGDDEDGVFDKVVDFFD